VVLRKAGRPPAAAKVHKRPRLLDPKSKDGARICYSDLQVFILESYYRFRSRPDYLQRLAILYVMKHLCRAVGDKHPKHANVKQVRRWFHHRYKMEHDPAALAASNKKQRERASAAASSGNGRASVPAKEASATKPKRPSGELVRQRQERRATAQQKMLLAHRREQQPPHPPPPNDEDADMLRDLGGVARGAAPDDGTSSSSSSSSSSESDSEAHSSASASSAEDGDEQHKGKHENKDPFWMHRTLAYKLAHLDIDDAQEARFSKEGKSFYAGYRRLMRECKTMPRSPSFVYGLCKARTRSLLHPDKDRYAQESESDTSEDDTYVRRIKTAPQQRLLEEEFARGMYLTPERMKAVRAATGLKHDAVRNWFNTRRERCHKSRQQAVAHWREHPQLCLEQVLYVAAYCLPTSWQRGLRKWLDSGWTNVREAFPDPLAPAAVAPAPLDTTSVAMSVDHRGMV
jgi:hypothetical protein